MVYLGDRISVPKALRFIEKPLVPLLLLLLPIIFVPKELTQPEFFWSADPRSQSLAVSAAIYAIVAYGLVMLMRFAGLPSVVHGALWGVGAYTAGIMVREFGWNYWAVFPLVALVPAAMALVTGAVALRTSGIAFIIITIALGDFLVLVANNSTDLTGGSFGLVARGPIDDVGPFSLRTVEDRYYLTLALLFLTIGLVWLISISSFGRRLMAIRDNEDLAKSLGLNAFYYKILIFTISAAVVGIAGQLFLYHTRAIQPSLFSSFAFINVLLMVMMGGLHVLAGPAVGAWLVTFLPEWLGPLGVDEPNRQRIVFGFLLMAFILIAPMGIAGTAKIWYFRLRNLALARRTAPTVVSKTTVLHAAEASAGNGAGNDHMPILTTPPVNNGPREFGETILEVRGLSKNFAAVQALRGVDISVRSGEILGVIGPNGSGKTTLFNCISGYLRPSAGDIYWRGQRVTGWALDRVARHGLVRTFQQPMLFASASVRESGMTALEALTAFGHRDIAPLNLPRDVDGLLSFCGLNEVADSPSAGLPPGLIRKLGVLMAVGTFPYLLMLDEPAAGLNDVESAELGELLRRVRDAGVTLVVVDHDVSFMMPLCDRIVVLDAGQKLCEGTPREVQADQRVIAAYLGETFAKIAAESLEAQQQ